MVVKRTSGIFMMVLDSVLRELQGKYRLVYVDYVIVFSLSLQYNVKNIGFAFQKLIESVQKMQHRNCELNS